MFSRLVLVSIVDLTVPNRTPDLPKLLQTVLCLYVINKFEPILVINYVLFYAGVEIIPPTCYITKLVVKQLKTDTVINCDELEMRSALL